METTIMGCAGVYIGGITESQIEKKMENVMKVGIIRRRKWKLLRYGVYTLVFIGAIMENQMDKKMENVMETREHVGVI